MSWPALIALDAAVWVVLIVATGYAAERIPTARLRPEGVLFRLWGFERGGRFYERVLGIKRWKGLLPDGAAVWRSGFRKKHLAERDAAYLQRFVQESCRAELVHWLMFPAWALFAFWNPPGVMAVMLVGMAVSNVPCIVTQRYNRARLERVLSRRATGSS